MVANWLNYYSLHLFVVTYLDYVCTSNEQVSSKYRTSIGKNLEIYTVPAK